MKRYLLIFMILLASGSPGSYYLGNTLSAANLGSLAALPPAPTITSFAPRRTVAGGTVTITGTDFTGVTAVSFGGIAAASFTEVSATSITAVVAAGITGNVSVTTPGGTANSALYFYYIGALTNVSWSSTSNITGATGVTYTFNYTNETASPYAIIYVSVNGAGNPFNCYLVNTHPEYVTVNVNGVSKSVAGAWCGNSWAYIWLTTASDAPAGSTIQVIINNVTNGSTAGSYAFVGASGRILTADSGGNVIDQAASANNLVLVGPPTITSFTPASAASGATVTITGTNFTGATAVSFGGTAATSFNVVSATSITAVVASGTTGTVSVSTAVGTCTSGSSFTFIACANPSSGGTIAADQTICSGFAPAAFTSSVAPSGHTGTLEYKWQLSTTSSSSGFADIASSNAATLTPGTLSATTWYKRLARVDCMADWTGAVASNVLQITVNQPSFSPGTFTVANLQATGTGIQWYAASSGGTALATSTALVNGTHYYASQTVNGVESTARFDATATILSTPCAPTGTASQSHLAGATVASLLASGTSIRWYAAASGGAALATSTVLVTGTHYYATQTVSCTESATRLDVTVSAGPLAIGDSYGGGKIAYILQSGDPGYVSGETHGLIAATSDQSTAIQWAVPAYQSTSVAGTLTTLGSGSANTDKIIAQNGTGSTYAAGLARAYIGGGYSDWYLPSKDELNELYLKRTEVGGFASAYYWSSSENYWSAAFNQYFPNNGQYSNDKSYAYYVRAVRAF
jgi:hypothetical protein